MPQTDAALNKGTHQSLPRSRTSSRQVRRQSQPDRRTPNRPRSGSSPNTAIPAVCTTRPVAGAGEISSLLLHRAKGLCGSVQRNKQAQGLFSPPSLGKSVRGDDDTSYLHTYPIYITCISFSAE